MSQIKDDPVLRSRALPGETIWEGFSDDEVIFQRPCPDCDKGLLTCPARFCGRCSGSGYLTRTEPRDLSPAAQVTRVHDHPPYRPICNERTLPSGQLRGACLNDDGTRVTAPELGNP